MNGKESKELRDIKNLLLLLLLKMGASGDEVATALDVTPGRISQVLPSKSVKPAQVELVAKRVKRKQS